MAKAFISCIKCLPLQAYAAINCNSINQNSLSVNQSFAHEVMLLKLILSCRYFNR